MKRTLSKYAVLKLFYVHTVLRTIKASYTFIAPCPIAPCLNSSSTFIPLIPTLNEETSSIMCYEVSRFNLVEYCRNYYPIASLDQGNIVGDFNGTLGNFGGDVQGLEERGLFGTKTSILGRHFDIKGSKGTSLGRGFDPVSHNHVPDGNKVFLGENKPYVSLDAVHQAFQFGVLGQVTADGLAHHGVLAHENNSMTSQRDTNLLHLLGTDIVSLDLK